MEKIIVTEKDIQFDITYTALIQDYLKEGWIPEVDKLLDWRMYLMNRDEEDYLYRLWTKKEILAVDYLLNLKQKP